MGSWEERSETAIGSLPLVEESICIDSCQPKTLVANKSRTSMSRIVDKIEMSKGKPVKCRT